MAERRKVKIVLEHHNASWVAYPIGMKGIVVGQGNTADEALEDVRSAIRFHLETFGRDAIDDDDLDLE